MSRAQNKDLATSVIASASPDASKSNWTAQKLPYSGTGAVAFDAGNIDSQGLPVASQLVPGNDLPASSQIVATIIPSPPDIWHGGT